MLASITGLIAAIAVRTAVALVRGQFLPAAPLEARYGQRHAERYDPPGVAGFAALEPRSAEGHDPRSIAGLAALGE